MELEKSIIGFISTGNNVIVEGAVTGENLKTFLEKQLKPLGYCAYTFAIKIPLTIA